MAATPAVRRRPPGPISRLVHGDDAYVSTSLSPNSPSQPACSSPWFSPPRYRSHQAASSWPLALRRTQSHVQAPAMCLDVVDAAEGAARDPRLGGRAVITGTLPLTAPPSVGTPRCGFAT